MSWRHNGTRFKLRHVFLLRIYPYSSQWRHNERDSVSNHQHCDCLLNRLFRRGSKKTSKLRVTGLFEGNSPVAWDNLALFPMHAYKTSLTEMNNKSIPCSHWNGWYGHNKAKHNKTVCTLTYFGLATINREINPGQIMAPSHYLNQCRLKNREVPWHLSEGLIIRRSKDTNQ